MLIILTENQKKLYCTLRDYESQKKSHIVRM